MPGRRGLVNFGRMAVVFLAVGIGLLVYTVQLFVSGRARSRSRHRSDRGLLRLRPLDVCRGDDQTPCSARWDLKQAEPRIHRSDVGNQHRAGVFLVGLVADVPVLIAVGAPLMGISLLIGIYLLLAGFDRSPSRPEGVGRELTSAGTAQLAAILRSTVWRIPPLR